ncbi:MAG: ATP-binding protein [Bacilli bacterium]|nr:ATP-binding protein [Bacilli bacterium]
MWNNQDLTLLSEGQIWGNDNEAQLEVIRKYGTMAAITDLCILTGGYLSDYNIDADSSLKGRTGWFWTKSDNNGNYVRIINEHGSKSSGHGYGRSGTVRPALQSSVIFSQIFPNRVRGYNGTEEVEYGEYPQYAADSRMQSILESEYNRRLNKTGRSYTFDSVKYSDYDTGFKPVTYAEYEFQGKNYIRIRANSDFGGKFKLSNDVEYRNGDYVWVEVSPVKWLIDDRTGLLISKRGLVSGIRFLDKRTNYKGDFSRTEMKEYLDIYMLRDLTQTAIFTRIEDMTSEEKEKFEEERKQSEKRRNPYGLNFGQVSEEEIIKGAIESGVAVFLHGPSSEGKSARVKQIDPTCEIIYLRNATPESLNGKSVYNGSTGEMIDVPPTWLKKLQAKCEAEPDRLHIVFFDEITNALPSIQGIAFNIVLDREVNGIWKLPENARIVAAGNDMKDSLAANQLAEPLFNRFAHVYIKTTTEGWLKWASEHNIHPAIYSYIAYKKGETLRSKYDGLKPNADPRKWEMASKMLYATGSPEMLRALVGEDITREFVEFCNQQVITLDDVINENYTDRDIQALNTAERYATTMGLSQVDDNNLEKVRDFVVGLGAEFGAIFDALWIHGDESKLERLAEVKLAEMPGGGIRR